MKYGLDPQEDALASGSDPSSAGWGREAEERWGTLADASGERAVETEPGDYPAYYAAIATALRDGGPPPVDPRDSIDGLRVIEAANRSARDGVVVDLDWELDPVTALRWGVLSPARIGTTKVIPATQAADRCEVVAIASRSQERAATGRPAPRHPPGPRVLRGAAGGSRGRCGLHPAARTTCTPSGPSPPPGPASTCCARSPSRCRWREAERMVVGVPRRRRAADGGVHVPAPPVVGRGARAGRRRAASATLAGVDVWFSYFNDDPTNIRNIAEVGGGALWDVGCYAVNVVRMLFGAEPTRVEAAIVRDPASGCES